MQYWLSADLYPDQPGLSPGGGGVGQGLALFERALAMSQQLYPAKTVSPRAIPKSTKTESTGLSPEGKGEYGQALAYLPEQEHSDHVSENSPLPSSTRPPKPRPSSSVRRPTPRITIDRFPVRFRSPSPRPRRQNQYPAIGRQGRPHRILQHRQRLLRGRTDAADRRRVEELFDVRRQLAFFFWPPPVSMDKDRDQRLHDLTAARNGSNRPWPSAAPLARQQALDLAPRTRPSEATASRMSSFLDLMRYLHWNPKAAPLEPALRRLCATATNQVQRRTWSGPPIEDALDRWRRDIRSSKSGSDAERFAGCSGSPWSRTCPTLPIPPSTSSPRRRPEHLAVGGPARQGRHGTTGGTCPGPGVARPFLLEQLTPDPCSSA